MRVQYHVGSASATVCQKGTLSVRPIRRCNADRHRTRKSCFGRACPLRRDRPDRQQWKWISVVALLVLTLPAPEAPAYRFYGNRVVPLAADALRWDMSVWAPEQMLTWVVANDPGWTAPWTNAVGEAVNPSFESAEDVVPFVSEALEAWSGIATADIRWGHSGVAPDLITARAEDERPTVFAGETGAYALIWTKTVRGVPVVIDCDVEMGPGPEWGPGWGPTEWKETLTHELGHCLGLGHAAAFPGFPQTSHHPGFPQTPSDLRGVFGRDSVMSYSGDDLVPLAHDDWVAASLLRPQGDWLAGTGRIAGVATVAGIPAPFVPVYAFPVTGPVPTGAVGSFTNQEGVFVVEGLAPGQYLLWAGALQLLDPWGYGDLLGQHPADVAEQVLMVPVTVVRDGTTDGVRIALRPNRPK